MCACTITTIRDTSRNSTLRRSGACRPHQVAQAPQPSLLTRSTSTNSKAVSRYSTRQASMESVPRSPSSRPGRAKYPNFRASQPKLVSKGAGVARMATLALFPSSATQPAACSASRTVQLQKRQSRRQFKTRRQRVKQLQAEVTQ